MRDPSFYSPAERRLLNSLPKAEAEVIEELMQVFDARLVENETDLDRVIRVTTERTK